MLRTTVAAATPVPPVKGPKVSPVHLYSSTVSMNRVAVDVLGPLPRTSRGNRYVLVAIDYFTKWIKSIPPT